MIHSLHRRHRTTEFKKFLVRIDKAVPADLDVHLICDNLATHKTAVIRVSPAARRSAIPVCSQRV